MQLLGKYIKHAWTESVHFVSFSLSLQRLSCATTSAAVSAFDRHTTMHLWLVGCFAARARERVCVCVCACACTCVHACACVCPSMCVCARLRARVCVCVCVSVCLRVCLCVLQSVVISGHFYLYTVVFGTLWIWLFYHCFPACSVTTSLDVN